MSPNCRRQTQIAAAFLERQAMLLAEGSFVLCVSEGDYAGDHAAFYDLFRLARDKVVEHCDTTEKIAQRGEWKNDNGRF